MAASSRWRADVRIGAARASLLILAGILAACGGPTPSSSAEVGPVVGCFGVELQACRTVAAGALAWLRSGGPPATYVQVGTIECDIGECQGMSSVRLEFVGAQPRVVSAKLVGDKAMDVTPVEVFATNVAVEPSSPRLAANVVPFDLGHCGIWSGIDVDGSFWDPVGFVNQAHPDVVNSAPGTFALTSATTATLRTNGGLTVQLSRHPGPKYLPGCD